MNTAPQRDERFLGLVSENRAKLLKIRRVYAWNPTEQDDLYQEILLQIWRALPTLKDEGHANTWRSTPLLVLCANRKHIARAWSRSMQRL